MQGFLDHPAGAQARAERLGSWCAGASPLRRRRPPASTSTASCSTANLNNEPYDRAGAGRAPGGTMRALSTPGLVVEKVPVPAAMLNFGKVSAQAAVHPAFAVLPRAHKLPRLADFRFHDTRASSRSSSCAARCAPSTSPASCVLGMAIALLYVEEPMVADKAAFLVAAAFTGVATVGAFELLRLYTLPAFTSFIRQMPRVLLGWTAAFALLIAAVFFLKMGHDFSRVWLALWYTAGAATLLGVRIARRCVVRHWTRQGRSSAAPPSTAAAPSPTISSASSRSTSTATCASPACSTTAATTASTASSSGYPRLGRRRRARRVRAQDAPRPRHRRAADHGREAPPAGDALAVGAADRGQAAGAVHPAALHLRAPTRASATSP